MNIGFTGHRPNKLFGFNTLDIRYKQLEFYLRSMLETIIDIAIENKENEICFYSGGALGFDTIAFNVVEDLKEEYKNKIRLCNILAIPFRHQPNMWSKADRDDYYEMVKKADKVYYVDNIDGYKTPNIEEGIFHYSKMANRNLFIIDKCDKLIACFNGEEGGTKHCIKNFIKRKKTNVLILNPNKLETELVYNI